MDFGSEYRLPVLQTSDEGLLEQSTGMLAMEILLKQVKSFGVAYQRTRIYYVQQVI